MAQKGVMGELGTLKLGERDKRKEKRKKRANRPVVRYDV